MIVRAGRHRFRPSSIGLVFGDKVSLRVVFTESCRYNLYSEDQLDINKLFGIGYFPHHHRNSARFGWRYSVEKDAIELFAYVYTKGKRVSTHIADAEIGKEYGLEISVSRGDYIFKVNGFWKSVVKGNPGWLGYKLGGYFGGNTPAPHDMEIIKR